MKIVFVGEAVSGFGGMETVIKSVIQYFRQDNFADCEMFFFCRHDKINKEWLDGVPTACSVSNIKLSLIRRERHIRAFSCWLKENRPDVVICIDVLACLLANKARIRSGHHFPLLSWPHFSLDHKKHADCVIYADRHLAISSGIKKQMLARGIMEENIRVIYNPVSPQSAIIPAPGTNETATFLYVGRMKFEGQKRVKDLLDALARTDGAWHLHAIGDGSDFQKCQAYAKHLKIDHCITWYGWQSDPWEVVRRDIKHVSALVLTSSFEGFGMVLLEAMAWGIPCISSKCVAGPEDIIIDGINGFLYPPEDRHQLVGLLRKFTRHQINLESIAIKQSIRQFYSDTYNRNMREAILSTLESSDK